MRIGLTLEPSRAGQPRGRRPCPKCVAILESAQSLHSPGDPPLLCLPGGAKGETSRRKYAILDLCGLSYAFSNSLPGMPRNRTTAPKTRKRAAELEREILVLSDKELKVRGEKLEHFDR